MTVGGINGLLAYNSVGDTRAISRRRTDASDHGPRQHEPETQQVEASTKISGADSEAKEATAPGQLSDAERKEVERLKARDREVRTHEQAHKAAAGSHSRGGPSYATTQGPDGRSYATEGSVSIDTSAIAGEPEKTLAKMQQVRRAALAPSEPSSQDARVAAEASQNANEARREIANERQEDSESNSGSSGENLEHTEVTQYGVHSTSTSAVEFDQARATRDEQPRETKPNAASSLEERYARAGANSRGALHIGDQLDLRV